ncbi:acyl-CoA/acyl-ACP dehydrogenase [Rhodococcus sp. H36-A4]|uniref:acyl-CoA dehydrogenase family protein n=1 Tax=Rhodococcus sp. H36-A4 TaxID=3004353 RepID=UPI0022AF1C3E|nr:acyl-CoA dehydrogenase family protein [Rhodococcus sp. H36-A4]MCZ4077997.1 acyl-CoA/acyl-ACP dehydrogenase [Rhodococcus sp. H36-A4]
MNGVGVFTEEQNDLRVMIRSLLDKRSDMRAAIDTDRGYQESLWQQLCEVGIASLAIPEEFGGAGFGAIESHVVLEELGRSLTPSPMLGSVVLAGQALLVSGDREACERLLPGIAEGSSIAALCWAGSVWSDDDVPVTVTDGTLTGVAEYVLDGLYADVLVVAASDDGTVSLYEVDPSAAGVTRRDTPTMDPTRRLSTVEFAGVTGRKIDTAPDTLAKVRDIACTALSADQIGAAAASLDMTVEYSRTRVQFGRPIGSFQALKHRMADMYVLLESAKSVSYAAARSLAEQLPSAHDDAGVAKVHCSEALSHIAADSIQIHGGIAITWEHDTHLYFKRAHGSAQLFGRPSEYVSRYAPAAV